MSNLVIARTKEEFQLKSGRVKEPITEVLPGSFIVKLPNEAPKLISFIDETGRAMETFIINDLKVFNLDNDIDSGNWEKLRIFIDHHREFKYRIILDDPQQKAKVELERDEKIFDIQSSLRAIKGKREELAQIYRRIVGSASNIDQVQMYNHLWKMATEKIDAFTINGKSIFEADDMELYSLVDLAIEKNILQMDESGNIRRNGGIIAKEAEEVVYILKKDPTFKEDLVFLTSNPEKEQDKGYKAMVEDSDLVNRINKFGKDVGVIPESEDRTVDEAEATRIFEAKLKANVDKLIAGGFVTKSGKNKFAIHSLPDYKLTLEELYGHFKQNPDQYEMMVNMAELK